MSVASNILGANQTDLSAAVTGSDRLAADKETFLKLLVAQLTNQDPLNPTEDKEFITQLAQFTSLEQLQSINAGVETLNTTMNQSQLVSATSFIGKSILADGSQITKYTEGIDSEGNMHYGTTDLAYTLDSNIVKGQVNVFDANGNLVYSEVLPAKNAGTHVFQWNGANAAGRIVPDGNYTAIVSAQDANDVAVMPRTQFVGYVMGVENKDGVFSLLLAGGRSVKFTDVVEIYESEDATGTPTPDPGNGSGETPGEVEDPGETPGDTEDPGTGEDPGTEEETDPAA